MKTDAIIVLGGTINKDGSLKESTQKRVEKGVELCKKYKCKIIFSGKGNRKRDITEAEAMKRYALTLGVNKKNILLEEKSADTFGNAAFTKMLVVRPNKFKNLIVVTSNFHIPRTERVFEKVFGDSYVLEFVASEMKYKHMKKQARYERRFLWFLEKYCLSKIHKGTDKELKEILRKYPLYSHKKYPMFLLILMSLAVKHNVFIR